MWPAPSAPTAGPIRQTPTRRGNGRNAPATRRRSGSASSCPLRAASGLVVFMVPAKAPARPRFREIHCCRELLTVSRAASVFGLPLSGGLRLYRAANGIHQFRLVFRKHSAHVEEKLSV